MRKATGHNHFKFNNCIVIILLSLIIFFQACYNVENIKRVSIYIKGSDTMSILVSRLAEAYMKENPGVAVYTEGGGTGTGVQALVNKEANICAASRPLRAQEVKLLADNFNSVGMAVRIAKDAVSVYLNNQNPVQNLTLEQLKKIYNGQFINWSQVGGINEPIMVLNRLPNSGTYLYLKEYVLNGQSYTEDAINMPSYQALLNKIEANRRAIGYGGLWSEASIKSCQINGVEPTWKNIMNDQYPLSRYLYFYTVNTPEDEVRDFIDWVLGSHGQKVIKDVGYFPIWEF